MTNTLNFTVLAINWQKYFKMVDWDQMAMTILEKNRAPDPLQYPILSS